MAARGMALPLMIVVLVDDALSLIGRKQSAIQLPRNGVTFGGTDFVAPARAYGGAGEWIAESLQLQAGRNRAENHTIFTIRGWKTGKNSYKGAF